MSLILAKPIQKTIQKVVLKNFPYMQLILLLLKYNFQSNNKPDVVSLSLILNSLRILPYKLIITTARRFPFPRQTQTKQRSKYGSTSAYLRDRAELSPQAKRPQRINHKTKVVSNFATTQTINRRIFRDGLRLLALSSSSSVEEGGVGQIVRSFDVALMAMPSLKYDNSCFIVRLP